ncbi:MAG: fructose-6-phosphate aldolase [Candidatus Magasanikbacteria bacterium]|jgi:transaldolase|nr:fructose-6-phosphate aldolase [Candidatus Magasanikbacteria bacterium]MBT5262476.1 fructose-6-phosphate aldolase [Candidatus Magasanikbacteria bacterium]MBT5820471.1 fructose-6-phosphate aldolase [Candidatus Magasanikbacteria bacterium]MBT6294425.1 fructose-6-phosphate aldolase [Candidatus Magasanikbacteria bacterium]
MKIFIDSGSIDEIKKAAASGVIDGVTTNPSLIAKEGKDFKTVIKTIGELFDTEHSAHCECPVSAEVVSIAAKEMIVEAKKIAKIHKKVVVKIPLIPEGIKAVKELSGLGIKTNVTLCFTAAQALLAAKAGATYVSPFIGRLNDIDQRGLDLIREIKQIFTNYDIKTQILAASIRSPRQVVEIALIGADVVTIPYKVFEKLFNHPLTDKGLKQFLADWDQYKKTQ